MNANTPVSEYIREHDITVDEVKACPIFAHLSDAEAIEVIETFKRFSIIIFDFYQRQKIKQISLKTK